MSRSLSNGSTAASTATGWKRSSRIAGGAGIPVSDHLTVGRKWTYKGKRYSYVNARCETGHLQVAGDFAFSDGTLLTGTYLKPCKAQG